MSRERGYKETGVAGFRTQEGQECRIKMMDIAAKNDAEKDAEKALPESELRYRAIMSESSDAIALVDMETNRFVDINKRWLRMMGYSAEEAVSLTIGDLFDDCLAAPGPSCEQMILGGSSPRTRRMRRKDGQIIDVEYSGSLISIPGKRLMLLMSRDLTEEIRLQEKILKALEARVAERMHELEQANRRIEAASAAKTAFLANMSHELRTPLNAIIGFSEVLQDELFGPLNERQERYVTDILNSGKHLLNLINDILDLSKIEAGKMGLELNRVNLEELCRSTVRLFQEKSYKSGIDLHCSVDAPMDAVMFADERKLKQILFNLVDNGVKFNQPGGSVAVRLDFAEEENGMYWRIQVDDTGIGIAAEDMPKLFEPFSQIESSYGKRYQGTGLGLSLTKRLVELHGGKISLESVPGGGSRFSVLIPAAQEPGGGGGDG